ncbi:hypothetical protein M0813_14551 [Anaeramoeba flamelloides]|uniref:KxDL domain-containing protein n=1 Tax=Anaeramoeba flamelloides TaxID=1746091 RepID=A0ABQ8Z529_9EUKA|nr:hypothetical protein M0813_14551 [Anaeramoeba flamelloides]
MTDQIIKKKEPLDQPNKGSESNKNTQELKNEEKDEQVFSSSLLNALSGVLDESEVQKIIKNQKKTWSNLQNSNQILDEIIKLSQQKYTRLKINYTYYEKILITMKKDLDFIYQKIRGIDKKLQGDLGVDLSLIPKNEDLLQKEEKNLN